MPAAAARKSRSTKGTFSGHPSPGPNGTYTSSVPASAAQPSETSSPRPSPERPPPPPGHPEQPRPASPALRGPSQKDLHLLQASQSSSPQVIKTDCVLQATIWYLEPKWLRYSCSRSARYPPRHRKKPVACTQLRKNCPTSWSSPWDTCVIGQQLHRPTRAAHTRAKKLAAP